MPVKKSALLLLLLSAGSLTLLVVSPAARPAATAQPANCGAARGDSQVNEAKLISGWDMIAQLMCRPVA